VSETDSAEAAGKTVIVIVRWGPPAPILLHFSGFTDRIRKDKKGKDRRRKCPKRAGKERDFSDFFGNSVKHAVRAEAARFFR